jgi:hypothetical protein
VSHSFVQRAPAIAEEILAKTASLPESLRSFTKNLLTKESSKDEGDRLELPKRMTLGELSKIAHENKVDLPKIHGVKSDDYAKIASELVAIAKREEQREANEVFESAAAIVAANHEKQAAQGAAAKMIGGAAGVVARPHGLFARMRPGAGGHLAKAEHEMFKAKHQAALAKVPGTPEHSTARAGAAVEETARAPERAAERRSELAEKAIAITPMVAAGVGAPLAAAALLASKGRGEKKEEVKIYK